MSEQHAATPEPNRLRASNADRERVAQVLNVAVGEGRLTLDELQERLDIVYGAKTLEDLEPVTRDLPGHHTALAAMPPPTIKPVPAASPQSRIGGTWSSTNAVAVMSGDVRKGRWVVPPRFNAVAIMGGVELDLTEARFGAPEVVINATAIMGGIEITVPDDITVECHGFGFMGGFQDDAQTVGPPGAPVVRITGFAMMGGVEVKRAKRRKNLT